METKGDQAVLTLELSLDTRSTLRLAASPKQHPDLVQLKLLRQDRSEDVDECQLNLMLNGQLLQLPASTAELNGQQIPPRAAGRCAHDQPEASEEGLARSRDACRSEDRPLHHQRDGATLQPIAGVRSYESLEVGEAAYTLGSPVGLELTLSNGIVSGRRDENGHRYVQTTAPISPGSSGGGLFDARGNLIGITTLALVGRENLNQALNFAIAADTFWQP
jgi:hypothetical protein